MLYLEFYIACLKKKYKAVKKTDVKPGFKSYTISLYTF